ncbi:MAG: CHASE2 domain-containing protein [Methylophilaceae bacterium]
MTQFSILKKIGVRRLFSLSIIALMLLHITGVMPIGFVNKLEQFSYDVRLNLFMPNTVDKRIVIVDIDEKSLKEQGQWPWSRTKLAALVDQLFATYHINTLGFDVVFAEKDESSGLKNLEWLQKNLLQEDEQYARALQSIKPVLDYDSVFANSLKNRKVVLGYYFLLNGDSQKVGVLPAPALEADSINKLPIGFTEAAGFGANLDLLQKNAASAGHFTFQPELDGITRKIPVLIKHTGNYYDALAIAMMRAYMRAPLQVKIEENSANKNYAGLEMFKLGKHKIPVDEDVAVLIPYRGRQGSFVYVSATDVLNKKVRLATLKNKIVLVGTTAAGLLDLRATPVQAAYPGVEIHANLIAGILDNNIKARPAYTLGAEFLLILLAGLLLTFYLPVLNPLKATLLTLGVLGAVLGIIVGGWIYANWVLPAAAILLMIGLIYFVNMSYGFFVESRGKRQLAGIFGQYVPPELVAEMAENPEKISLVGESREMTVLFSDIRGFTTISEGLDPKQLTQLMGEFLTPLTQVIHHNRGTIDKYMGDAIMAFWGAPLRDGKHAEHAMKAALEMQAEMGKINEKFAAKGWPAIQIGVGLNTGNMVVGNMGSSFRMAYTAMGDAVNLGSRVEGLTKFYGVDIIATEFVKAQTPETIYRDLDLVRVKGKDKAVFIYEPLGSAEKVSEGAMNALNTYHIALNLYRKQEFKLAEKLFKELQKIENLSIYSIYIERIHKVKNVKLDAGWNGVHIFESK